MYITMATYDFNGYGLCIKDRFEIVRETEKCYFAKTGRGEHRFLKSDIGELKHNVSDYCPHLKLILIDATEEELREKIAQWFDKQANRIRKTN